jgi:spore maturation protein CgeB
MNILYVGAMLNGSTTLQRAQALRDMGHRLYCINTERSTEVVVKYSIYSRIRRRITGPQDLVDANSSILHALHTQRFDLLWIDKGLTINAKTLEYTRKHHPACRIVGFSPDDMLNKNNQSRHFLSCLPLYHFYVTTKSFNVSELRGLGCPEVLFVDKAYDPHTHRPLPVTDTDRQRLGGRVGFIGQWEPARADSLRALALAGVPVRVWGYTWERMKNVPPGLIIENEPLWGDDYARAIAAFDINLCFLRKCNRDLQTSRSIEIPACGGFMLAERTCEHLRLFVESKEAEFFDDDDELIRKTYYYLDHLDERDQIAHGGLNRCEKGGYSYLRRLGDVLERISSL